MLHSMQALPCRVWALAALSVLQPVHHCMPCILLQGTEDDALSSSRSCFKALSPTWKVCHV